MSIDVSTFTLVNVVDTCAVWNLLSSKLLYSSSKAERCDFCITSFVQYECLNKQRSRPSSAAELELINRLQSEKSSGSFMTVQCDIEDLQAISMLERRRKLGKGELSSIAFAMKAGLAVMTDDQRARRLAKEVGLASTQTTPHLLGWLVFKGRLCDHDKKRVIDQHVEMDGPLEPHFERAYILALEMRLNTP